jgi:hypothetical protein
MLAAVLDALWRTQRSSAIVEASAECETERFAVCVTR